MGRRRVHFPATRLRVAAGLLPLVIAGCSAAPRAAPVSRMPPPEDPPAISAARTQAAEQFYHGKSLALAGEGDCAREAFRDALETFRVAARAGNPSDLAFASELYDSIALYRSAIGAGARAAEAERPPAEDPRDSLVATAPLPSPDEVEKAKTEVGVGGLGNRLRHSDRRERRRAQGRRLLPVPDAHGLRGGPQAQRALPRPHARHPQGGGPSAGSRLRRDGRVGLQVPGSLARRRPRLLAVHRRHGQALRPQAEALPRRAERSREVDARRRGLLPRPLRDVRGLVPRDGRVRRRRGADPEGPPAHGRARLLGARGGHAVSGARRATTCRSFSRRRSSRRIRRASVSTSSPIRRSRGTR